MPRDASSGSLPFHPADDLPALLSEVLKSAMYLVNADKGDVQLYDAARQSLLMTALHGFDAQFAAAFNVVPLGAAPCGTAAKRRARVVIADSERDPLAADPLLRQAASDGEFRACASTPLINAGGDLLGVMTVHFRQPHPLTDAEAELLDACARLATEHIEAYRGS
jgi:GAF domain-containing protein